MLLIKPHIIVTIIAIATIFLVMGDMFIGRAEPTHLFGDALVYIYMAEGNFADADPPFKYRIVVPLVAWLLPFEAELSLKIVSYAGLFLFYIVILMTCRSLGFNLFVSASSLFALFSTVWHLYNYQNPYLADTVALMLISVLLVSFVRGSFITFLTTTALIVITREITIALVPIWLWTKQWSRAATAIGIGVSLLIVVRWILSSEPNISSSIIASLSSVDRINNMQPFVRIVVLNWGFVGVLTILGLLLTPIDKRAFIVPSFCLLLIAAIVSSFLATDVGRMFSILSPVIVIGCAQLFAVLAKKHNYLTFFLLVACTAQLFWVPTVFSDRDSWIFDTVFPRLILASLETILIVVIMFTLRQKLIRAVRPYLKVFNNSAI